MDGSVESLSDHLATLKSRGANLLLLSPPSVRPSCRGLLGDDGATRRRLFVDTGDGSAAAGAFVEDGPRNPAVLGYVTVEGAGTRAAAAATVGPSPRSDGAEDVGWHSRVESAADTTGLALAMHRHLERFESRDPDPGEVRVCFDSLDPLVETLDDSDLFRFLHTVTNRVRSADGLGHFHLTDCAEETTIETLRPLFEATVEQRSTPEGPAQRWTFRDTDVETDWIPVE
jgi:hypothetical protein